MLIRTQTGNQEVTA